MAKVKDPSKKKTKKKLAVHPFEIVWYALCCAIMVWGLTYITLGLVAENLPIKAENEGLVKVNLDFAGVFGLDFLGWGLIILAIGAVAAVIVLIAFSSKVDRDYEKNVRRAQRLAQLEEEEAKEEAAAQEEIIDAEVAPVEEQKD